MINVRIRLPEKRTFEIEMPLLLDKGDRLFLDMVVYEIEERGWIFAGSKSSAYLILSEIEGTHTPPSGRYAWITEPE